MFLLSFFLCTVRTESNIAICINRIKSKCNSPIQTNSSTEFENLFHQHDSVQLEIYNNVDLPAYLSLNAKYGIKKLTLLGGTSDSIIYVDLYNCNFTGFTLNCTNITVIFTYGPVSQPDTLTLDQLFLENSKLINSQQILCRTSKSDLYSLCSFQSFTFSLLELKLKNFENQKIESTLRCQDDGRTQDIFLLTLIELNDTYNINFLPQGILISFPLLNSSVNFTFDSYLADISIKDNSMHSTVGIYSFNDQYDLTKWVQQFFTLSIQHLNDLSLDLNTDIQLSRIIAKNISLKSALKHSLDMTNIISENRNFIDRDENCVIYLSSLNFMNCQITITDEIQDGSTDLFKERTFTNLTLLDPHNTFTVSDYYGYKLTVINDIVFKSKINYITPVYDKLLYPFGDSLNDIINKPLLSICSSNIREGNFQILHNSPITNYLNPIGFSQEDNSFSLQYTDKCVSLVLDKPPSSFYKKLFLFYGDNVITPQGYTAYDISKYRYDFKFSEHYIVLSLDDSIPSTYLFNFTSLLGKHEITFQATNRKTIRFLDNRNSSLMKLTTLIFENINVQFESELSEIKPSYESITLNNSEIISNSLLDLSEIPIIMNYQYGKTFTSFYNCKSIEFHEMKIDEIVFAEKSWIFRSNGKENTIISYKIPIICQFDAVINLRLSASKFKSDDVPQYNPIVFRFTPPADILGSATFSVINIELTENFNQIELMNAITIEFSSNSVSIPPVIQITTSNGIIPFSFDGFRKSSSLEDLNAISIVTPKKNVEIAHFQKPLIIGDSHSKEFVGIVDSGSDSIPAHFPSTILNSDVVLTSVNLEGISQNKRELFKFNKVIFYTNNLTVRNGTALLMYSNIIDNLILYPETVTNLFHTSLGNKSTILYMVEIGKNYPKLRHFQQFQEIPIKSSYLHPYFIPDDENELKIQNIVIHHYVTENTTLDNINSSANNIIIDLPSDTCEKIIRNVSFSPDSVQFQNGNIVFEKNCIDNHLFVQTKYIPDSNSFDHNILLIVTCTACAVLAIIGIIFFGLWMGKRKLIKTQEYIRETLLVPPKDL